MPYYDIYYDLRGTNTVPVIKKEKEYRIHMLLAGLSFQDLFAVSIRVYSTHKKSVQGVITRKLI